MDLAEQLIQQQQLESRGESDYGMEVFTDELGISRLVRDLDNPKEVINDPMYWALRIIMINRQRVAQKKQGLIHKRGNLLYIGNDILPRKGETVDRLAKPRYSIPQRVKAQVWDEVFDRVPTLSYDKLVISRNLAFDRIAGELVHDEKGFQSIGRGGING